MWRRGGLWVGQKSSMREGEWHRGWGLEKNSGIALKKETLEERDNRLDRWVGKEEAPNPIEVGSVEGRAAFSWEGCAGCSGSGTAMSQVRGSSGGRTPGNPGGHARVLKGPVQRRSKGRMACNWTRADLSGTSRRWERTADPELEETVSPVLWSVHFTVCKLYPSLLKNGMKAHEGNFLNDVNHIQKYHPFLSNEFCVIYTF